MMATSACSSSAVDPTSNESAEPIVFSDDPFSEEGIEIVEANVVEGIEATSSSKLVEVDSAPLVIEDAEIARQNSELNLTVLQAKIVADELSKLSNIDIGDPVHTMGENLRVNLSTQNPFGDVIELVSPSKGLVFEFNWTVERWGALTGSDKVQRHRVYRYPDWFVLEPGDVFEEFTMLPLESDGAPGAVWVVEIDARIRCEGVMQSSKKLPVHQIDFNAVKFLVLPKGWQEFAEQPLESLRQVLEVDAEVADLHVMVCCTLLPNNQRATAVQLLIDKLREGGDAHRALSVTQALNWITREELGSLPHVWLEWADQYKL
ncbi:MAG: hypothetical protein H8E25_11835 [Planctomycetes bacterium]|nr:hypothetical protein [Planctomycetota bacterium]